MLASLVGISKYFGDKLILRDVEVTIEDHDRIGLVGANGIGKSTLLNILCENFLRMRALPIYPTVSPLECLSKTAGCP